MESAISQLALAQETGRQSELVGAVTMVGDELRIDAPRDELQQSAAATCWHLNGCALLLRLLEAPGAPDAHTVAARCLCCIARYGSLRRRLFEAQAVSSRGFNRWLPLLQASRKHPVRPNSRRCVGCPLPVLSAAHACSPTHSFQRRAAAPPPLHS